MTLVVKIQLCLELIRFLLFVVKQVLYPVPPPPPPPPPPIPTSSSFVIVCIDGRDMLSANKGMKVFDVGQFDFS